MENEDARIKDDFTNQYETDDEVETIVDEIADEYEKDDKLDDMFGNLDLGLVCNNNNSTDKCKSIDRISYLFSIQATNRIQNEHEQRIP